MPDIKGLQLIHQLCADFIKKFFIIIRCYAIRLDYTAVCAAVQQGPLAIILYPDSHRLHPAATKTHSVARPQVHMPAPQTMGTVIAMRRI
jgi:hypothetical protein